MPDPAAAGPEAVPPAATQPAASPSAAGPSAAGPSAVGPSGAGLPAAGPPGSGGPRTGSRGDPISLRLALAFLGVALVAVALLAGLLASFAADDVSSLAAQQRADLARAVAVAAAATQTGEGSWTSADLAPVLDLAAQAGVAAKIIGPSGETVVVSANFAAQPAAAQASAPIMVHGRRAGQVMIRSTPAGLGRADSALQDSLWLAIAGAAGAAALLALITGLAAARRITRPVQRLITVTRAMAGGDRTARVGAVRAPGELAELASAFDQMADTLGRQEQLRRDLVAGVAHELRTPIAVLQAGHEALLDGVTQPTPAELGSLHEEVLRLATMVSDLQTLAAADAAVLQLSLSPQDLGQLAAAAADSLSGQFQAAGITVRRELAPATVQADPRWLHQIVTNLLTNALKFTAVGGTVTVLAGPAGTAARPQAVLRVTDTGVGIPADELPRIFDRFWRGRQAARVPGSGVGLAVAAELARAHGGELTAASKPGQGTEITLTLPLST
jgi:two-component system, OmpR family, sensor histidine kinase BaeS